MYRIYFILIALLLTNSARAQLKQPCSTCLPEGIYFSTQASIDNFQTNYPDCRVIDGDVLIYSYYITNLEGLSVLTAINGNLSLTNNNALFSLSGLENLTYIGGDLVIAGNDSILNLNGFDHLTFIQGHLEIDDNVSLINLVGLDSLNTIGGNLSMYGNDNLLNLSGLDKLNHITGGLYIGGNDKLIDIENVINISSVSDVIIYNNFVLTSLEGLNNLTSVNGHLEISGNYNLPSLNGLENIISVGGNLTIRSNSALINLAGLEGITFIAGELHISDNNTLANLSGLENIDANTISNLSIRYNDYLSTCDVQSICGYLAAPNGTIDITGNYTGCNSEAEVAAACEVGIDESSVVGRQSSVNIHPNPATDLIFIEILESKTHVQISIFDLNGRQILVRENCNQNQILKVAELNSGIYFVKIITDEAVLQGKFIKQ